VIAVPDWFEQPVCEPKHQDILHRLFPQVVVNAINLVFFQEPVRRQAALRASGKTTTTVCLAATSYFI
jgi:hypothetical protein